jgi:hypothetical protein
VVDVVATAQRTKPGKWDPHGAVTQLGRTTAAIPAGATQTVAIDVPVKRLRDPLSRAGGAAIATLSFRDAGTEVAATGVYVEPHPNTCGGAAYPRVASGRLDEDDQRAFTAKHLWQRLYAPGISRGTSYRVTSRRASLSFNGVRWTLKRGSQFTLTCTGLSDDFHGRAFPALFLDRGDLRAKGRPHGGLPAVTVVTSEGNLGMRRAERTDLEVSRNPRRQVSRMHVRRGDSGQITTFFKGVHNGQQSSPCTSGHSLSVNRWGVIRAV